MEPDGKTEERSFLPARLHGFLCWASAAAMLAWSLSAAAAEPVAVQTGQAPWWVWVVALFFLTLVIGFGSVLAGVGGGVVFVPVLAGFFPFHMDFVRGAGILVALATALAASPKLLRGHLVRLRLALPCALVASVFAIIGVQLGFALPVEVLQVSLGVMILGVAALMIFTRSLEYPEVTACDGIARALNLQGRFLEESTGEIHPWRVHRTLPGLASFSLVGLIAGLFGLGAGWANVPVLNIVMGVPLKMAVATSVFLLSVTDTAAAWGYLNRGAVLPMLVAPCLAGVMIGSRLGALVLPRIRTEIIRRIVIVVMLSCGLRALLKGLSLWN